MAQIKFDSAIVSDCKDQVEQHRQTLRQIIEDVQQQVTTADGAWEGSASQQFVSTFQSAKTRLDNSDRVMVNYVAFLTKAIEDYQQTESQIQGDVSSFEGGN